jgi:ribonuclease P protein component
LRARSNTALFPTRYSHEAHLSAVQNASRAAPRVSRAQPHPRRTSGIAASARARPPAARAVTATAAPKRFGLDAAHRLRDKAQFERLLRKGARRSFGGFTFFVGHGGGPAPRLGILISRKHAAAAVERNRIKRCIREAFRLEQHNLRGLEVLVRPPYGVPASRFKLSDLRELLRRLAT